MQVVECLPAVHRHVLLSLLGFFRKWLQPSHLALNRLTLPDLSNVFGDVLLRNPSKYSNSPSPRHKAVSDNPNSTKNTQKLNNKPSPQEERKLCSEFVARLVLESEKLEGEYGTSWEGLSELFGFLCTRNRQHVPANSPRIQPANYVHEDLEFMQSPQTESSGSARPEPTS